MKLIVLLAGFTAALTLAACSQPAPPPAEPSAAETAAPVAEAEPAAAASITAPAGKYELDPAHASLSFSVGHLGLSNYVARFTQYSVALDLDPANLSASSVVAIIDAASIRTDYPGDYRAGHKDSPYATWDEDLAKSPKFFNAAQHPKIEFRSTAVTQSADGALRIEGTLSLLGQTHPLTLDAKVVGAAAAHPFMPRGAIGFSAQGSFDRSQFGMTHLLKPPLVGDQVTVSFEGEMHQVVAPATTPAT